VSDYNLRIRPNKVGSVCNPFELGPYVTISPLTVAEEGVAVACRVLTQRKTYGHLELGSGRTARLVPGDIMIGVLGNRAALRGFCGRVPTELKAGDTLALLNQGGVIGVAEGAHAGLGSPIQLEVLGTPIRDGRGLRLKEYALPQVSKVTSKLPPVLLFIGTSMSAGKTTAASVIVRYLASQGKQVNAGKITGVACIKDLQHFEDNGAGQTLSFLDFGLPSTAYHSDVLDVALSTLEHLARENPDVIVIELGDGLLGEYGVDELIASDEFTQHLSGAVCAANDIIGGVALADRLKARGVDVKLVTGPATDNAAGTRRIERAGTRAANIILEPQRVCELATAGLF